MSIDPAPAPTVRLQRSGRGPRRAVLAAAAVLLLSVVRPWGDGGSRPDVMRAVGLALPGGQPGPTTAAAAPSATDGPAPATERPSPGPGQVACPLTGSHVVSLDRLGGWTVRTTTPASTAAAAGPLDPAIPWLVLESPAVLGLAVCAAAPPELPGTTGTAHPRPLVLARAWRLEAGAPVPVALAPLGPPPSDPRLVVLYRPDVPRAPGSPPPPWPPGRYVVDVLGAGGEPPRSDASGRGSPADEPRVFLGIVVPPPR